MGFYIETPYPRGKAEQIVKMVEGAKIVGLDEAHRAMQLGLGVVVVLHNGPFDAAGFTFDMKEFEDFTRSSDRRMKTFVVMDRAKAVEMSGYREKGGR